MNAAANQIRAPFHQVSQLADESFRMIEIRGGNTGCSWHFHPEHQIGCVIEGRGERVVGDSIQPICAGEFLLLGSNLPHVWRFDHGPTDSTHAIVIHFRDDFLGSEFFAKPEMRDVRLLLARAALGLQATGEMKLQAASIVRAMLEHSGMDRILDLLALLHLLAGSQELEALCSSGFQPLSTELEIERLRRTCAYVQSNIAGEIDRDSAAKIAHLSPSAFSRFFKAHTGKTFQEYVIEIRIGNACRLLMEQQLSITDIAANCGFSDVSSFDRSFRRVRDASPSEYRRHIASVVHSNAPVSIRT